MHVGEPHTTWLYPKWTHQRGVPNLLLPRPKSKLPHPKSFTPCPQSFTPRPQSFTPCPKSFPPRPQSFTPRPVPKPHSLPIPPSVHTKFLLSLCNKSQRKKKTTPDGRCSTVLCVLWKNLTDKSLKNMYSMKLIGKITELIDFVWDFKSFCVQCLFQILPFFGFSPRCQLLQNIFSLCWIRLWFNFNTVFVVISVSDHGFFLFV